MRRTEFLTISMWISYITMFLSLLNLFFRRLESIMWDSWLPISIPTISSRKDSAGIWTSPRPFLVISEICSSSRSELPTQNSLPKSLNLNSTKPIWLLQQPLWVLVRFLSITSRRDLSALKQKCCIPVSQTVFLTPILLRRSKSSNKFPPSNDEPKENSLIKRSILESAFSHQFKSGGPFYPSDHPEH